MTAANANHKIFSYKNNKLHCLLFFCLFLFAFISGVHAETLAPQVRGQLMRNFVRLTFEWPETTLFTAKASGNKIAIQFDRKAKPDMRAVLKQMNPYIIKAESKGDGRTIILTLDKPHRIRTFVSDNISGIDILDVKNHAKISTAKISNESHKEPLKEINKQAQDTVKTEIKTEIQQETKEEKIKQSDELSLAELAPSAGEEANHDSVPAPSAIVEDKKPESHKKANGLSTNIDEEAVEKNHGNAGTVSMIQMSLDRDEKAEETDIQADNTTNNSAENNSADAPPELASKNNNEAVETEAKPALDKPAVEASEAEVATEPLSSNKIVISADVDGATLRFPLKQRTAAAVFIRMNTLWVVFDKKLDFDISEFANLTGTLITKAENLTHDTATIIRITVNDNVFAKIKQQEGQTDIAVLLSYSKSTPDKPLDVLIKTEPPAPAHVFLSAMEVGNIIEFVDSDIGDNLIVTPFYTIEQGIAKTRNFVEFSLLASTQGLAIAKKSDATEVTLLRNGLRISLPKGAHLSSEASGNIEAAQTVLPASASGTLFSDSLWQIEPNKSYNLTINKLFHQTVFGANDGVKNLARLRMAQLYLRDGMAVEALGFLNVIQKSNPSYYRSAKLAAMRGAANFLLYRFNDAARDFASAELNDNPEISYWRDMIADLLGAVDKNYDFLAMNDSYISKYPPAFRQRLAIVAADRAIASKKYNVAIKIFDSLSKDNILTPIEPYVDFLTAKISAENGQEQEALEVWNRLTAESRDKFVQARAAFSVILWQLDNNVIKREEAADRLERLRLSWHGDGLELQIVEILGDLYLEKSDYVNAMRVWQIAVAGFRNTGPAIEMEKKMEEVFVKLFNEGIADKMRPIDALALYYEYRQFLPSGATGTQMIEKLADRLIGVDLLSAAGQLLEQQMRTQMEKADRSRIGAKLADIYLNNNQPKRAQKALQDSVYGDNPILLRIQRNQLTARVMIQLGRMEEAITVLGQDESVGAEKLRAMIYWEQKNWEGLAGSVENIVKKRPDPSAIMDAEESEFVLRLALAYVFQQDREQLQYMRDYFTPLLADGPSKKAFDFITMPDVNLTTRNFDEFLAALSKTRDFVKNYKARADNT